jgi:hypothetical protein
MKNLYWKENEAFLRLQGLEIDDVPKNLNEVFKSKIRAKWIEAIQKDLGEMQERGVFLETDKDHIRTYFQI